MIMASPGMMQSGLSRELFESWCTDPKNGVIIAGKIKNSLLFSKNRAIINNIVLIYIY